ncbi:helix-turn-helix domain-containing protein [Micromonospora sp. NPDC048894]|uniref:helix-turn-helix domain-containing protein n=1 Tax=Micromonospora sp. NPDC048894 TaxID=3155493 RepID=UPI0033C69D6F
MFADRLGKSKSWVDKIERGVRTLDKVSTLQHIAAVLRIDPGVLLGRDARSAEVTGWTADVARIRVALSRLRHPAGPPGGQSAGATRRPGGPAGGPRLDDLPARQLSPGGGAAAGTAGRRGTRPRRRSGGGPGAAGGDVPGHGVAAGQAGRAGAGVAGGRSGDGHRDRRFRSGRRRSGAARPGVARLR